MLVLVRYNDDNYDIVEDYCLEYLIVTGKVVEFSRSDEWVTVDAEPTREKPQRDRHHSTYTGPERRKQHHRNLLHTPASAATS